MRTENLSPKVKKARNEYSRVYKEKQRRAAGTPIRNLTNPRFDGKRLYDWLQRFIVEEEIGYEIQRASDGNWGYQTPFTDLAVRKLLNGLPLDPNDDKYIRRLPNAKRVNPRIIDRIATKHDLPLWEIEEAAGRYKADIRTRRKARISTPRSDE